MMTDLASVLCFLIAVTGSIYCVAALLNCLRRLRSRKMPDNSSAGPVANPLLCARFNCLCEFVIAAISLAVAVCLLAGFAGRAALLSSQGSTVDQSLQRAFETFSLQDCPPVIVDYNETQPGRPIVGMDCSMKPISDTQLPSLLREAPQLCWLILSATNITDNGLCELKRLPKLEDLTLSHTRIGDSGLLHLATLKGLRSLHLDRTKITDNGVRWLADLPNLQSLGLSNTVVTDASLEYLGRLDKLRFLEIDNTDITLEGFRRLESMLPNVEISYCQVDEQATEVREAMNSSRVFTVDQNRRRQSGMVGCEWRRDPQNE